MFNTTRTTHKEKTQGNLYLIGGHEDKEGEKSVLQFVLDSTQATQITLIPTASSIPRDLWLAYERAFQDLGVHDLVNLDIRTREEADKEEYVHAIQNSQLVFFTGGDQVHLLEKLAGTRIEHAIRERWMHGMPIAGTSAGAAAMSRDMIYDGDGIGLQKGTVCHMPGFGFLDDIVVDTHFDVRQRLPRLYQAIAAGYGELGIGLSEDTGMLITPDQKGRVFGRGYVSIVSKAPGFCTNYQQITEGAPWSVHNARLSLLYPDDVIDFTENQVWFNQDNK